MKKQQNEEKVNKMADDLIKEEEQDKEMEKAMDDGDPENLAGNGRLWASIYNVIKRNKHEQAYTEKVKVIKQENSKLDAEIKENIKQKSECPEDNYVEKSDIKSGIKD